MTEQEGGRHESGEEELNNMMRLQGGKKDNMRRRAPKMQRKDL